MIPFSIRRKQIPLVKGYEVTKNKDIFWWIDYLKHNGITNTSTCEYCKCIYNGDVSFINIGFWEGHYNNMKFHQKPYLEFSHCCSFDCFKENIHLLEILNLERNIVRFVRNVGDVYISEIIHSNSFDDNSWLIKFKDNYWNNLEKKYEFIKNN